MSERNRYDDRERRRYDQEDDQGFFDEVRDWFRGDDRERNRDYDRERSRDRQDEINRDRWQDWNQNRQGNMNRGYERDWEQGSGENRQDDWDRDRWQDWKQDRQSGVNRDYGRDYGRDLNRDRQRDWGQNRQRDWQSGQRFDRDYGRKTYGDRYRWNYNRGWRGEQEYQSDEPRDFGRQGYGPQEGRRFRSRWQQDRDFDRGQRGEQYGTAGMRSDYGTDYDYEDDYSRNQRSGEKGPVRDYPSRDRDYGSRDRDYGSRDRNYDRSYVGYDREGAFYQDLDEPYSYEYWEVWTIPGEFTGVGPETYQRSDERIHDDVCERLTQHGRINARDIEIEVKEGQIVLSGSVPTREMKRMAEDLAESVSGQKEVRNEIRVSKQDQQRKTELHAGSSTAIHSESTMGTPAETRAGQTGTGGVETKRSHLRQGMEVIGKNGKIVGRVKEVRDLDFLVDRDMARDVYVPLHAVQSIGAQAMLEVAADEVDNQDWETPDLL